MYFTTRSVRPRGIYSLYDDGSYRYTDGKRREKKKKNLYKRNIVRTRAVIFIINRFLSVVLYTLYYKDRVYQTYYGAVAVKLDRRRRLRRLMWGVRTRSSTLPLVLYWYTRTIKRSLSLSLSRARYAPQECRFCLFWIPVYTIYIYIHVNICVYHIRI